MFGWGFVGVGFFHGWLGGFARRFVELLVVEYVAVVYEVNATIEPSALEVLRDDKSEKYGLSVDIDAGDDGEPISSDLVRFLVWTVRELLFNVVKHSGARTASVVLRRDRDWLRVEVRDDGRGFDPSTLTKTAGSMGLGLLGLRQRLELMGGDLEIVSAHGKGCSVQISVPDDSP